MSQIPQQKWLKAIPMEIGWYLAGFADGEGSFNVSLKRIEGSQLGWQVEPSFNVSQRDITILALFKRTLGCGTLRKRKDGVVYYEVRNLRALKERVIPFFERFPFRSATKKSNFSIFRRIILMMTEGRHLDPIGLKEILRLREKLNSGRGRKIKYTFGDYVDYISHRKSSEAIRQRGLKQT
jgi:hypothetical protein